MSYIFFIHRDREKDGTHTYMSCVFIVSPDFAISHTMCRWPRRNSLPLQFRGA